MDYDLGTTTKYSKQQPSKIMFVRTSAQLTLSQFPYSEMSKATFVNVVASVNVCGIEDYVIHDVPDSAHVSELVDGS